MKAAPVSLSAVAVVALVLLFAGIAVVGAQNLHASAALGGTGDNTSTCAPATARPTRTPAHGVAPGGLGTVHADIAFIPCITAATSPSPVLGVTGRPTRTPKPPISTSQPQ